LATGEQNSLPLIGRVGDVNPFASQVPLEALEQRPITGDQVLAVVPEISMTRECALSEIDLPGMTPIAGDRLTTWDILVLDIQISYNPCFFCIPLREDVL